MLSAQGFKVDLSAIHFFSIGGQISCFFKGFSCDGEDGGGGGGGGGGSEGGREAVIHITGCFLNGPNVFFLKKTANSVLG